MKGLPIVAGLQVALFILQSSHSLFAYAAVERDMDLRQVMKNKIALEDCLETAQLPFEVQDWSKVNFLLQEYASLGGKVRRAMEKRMAAHLPSIARSLREKGLPEALQYLPLAESRLYTKIGSPAGARGIWQIMPATARAYGLTVNSYVDEREDPLKSTAAAIKLLTKLYEEFGDWKLVLAAYNCGSSKVRRAMEKSNCDNYWDIDHLLPAQTRTYVPAFIAAACYAGYLRNMTPSYQIPYKSPGYAGFQAHFWRHPMAALLSGERDKVQQWISQTSSRNKSAAFNT